MNNPNAKIGSHRKSGCRLSFSYLYTQRHKSSNTLKVIYKSVRKFDGESYYNRRNCFSCFHLRGSASTLTLGSFVVGSSVLLQPIEQNNSQINSINKCLAFIMFCSFVNILVVIIVVALSRQGYRRKSIDFILNADVGQKKILTNYATI